MLNFSKELEDFTKDKEYLTLEKNENIFRVVVSNKITKEVLNKELVELFELENKYYSKEEVYCLLDLKNLDGELLKDCFKIALTERKTTDPLMITNIINLIKTYNTLDDSFFENRDVYFSSLVEYLDIKLELKELLDSFNRDLAIRFYSLLKSNNKINMDDNSDTVELEEIFKIIFNSIDFSTVCGILSVVSDFSTKETFFIKNAKETVDNLLSNSYISNTLLQSFLGYFNNGNENK